ncbi:MAG: DUF2975 domain-containing protein [Pirellulaceae bacterium]|nr:DUF2975 domain-containing protein [Pirellulaceae bacterium]
MEANNADFDGGRSLRRWNRALAVLAWLGIAWAMYVIGDEFVGPDFSIGFKTESGIKLLDAGDFTIIQRAIVVLISIPQILCWIYCLWQIVKLSKQFSRGEILSIGMVQCLEGFGFGLAAQGVAEFVHAPILAAYLLGIGKIDSVDGIWQLLIGGGVLTSMMAAVLLVVITRILRIGIRFREEAELTI